MAALQFLPLKFPWAVSQQQGRGSRQKGNTRRGWLVACVSWRRQHIYVDLGQRHEQLSPLVVAEVIQFHEPALQDGVWVVSQRNEELGDALDGALLQGLDHVVVLGQGHRDAACDKRASTWANQLQSLDCQSSESLTATVLMLFISLATGPSLATAAEGPGAAALFPRTLGKGRPAPQPALILRLGVSMAKTWLRVETGGRSPL